MKNFGTNPWDFHETQFLKIKELCLAGACHRGISYIGVLQYLEEVNLIDVENLEKVIGVSIGSFVAACYISGFTPTEFMKIVIDHNISKLKDISLLDSDGLSILRGTAFRNWIKEIISIKIDPEITMKEFYEKTKIHFIIITTCIQDGIVQIDHEKTPDMKLFDALIASMNFPFAFPPYIIDGKQYVDGGLLDNFPMHMLGPDAVGFKVNFEEINNINTPFSYIGKLFELISQHRNAFLKPNSRNIIEVNASDFGIIDFDMSVDDKITLYKRGYNAAKNSNLVKVFKNWKHDYNNVVKEITKKLDSKENGTNDA